MKELQAHHAQLVNEATQLMREGNIKAYLAKLIKITDVRTQMAQLSTAA
jgi:hypothetical protein